MQASARAASGVHSAAASTGAGRSLWKLLSCFFYFLGQMKKKKTGEEKTNVGGLRWEEKVQNSHPEK